MKDKEPKMVQYLDRLTYVEQQIICRIVREHSGEQRYAHLHPGLLPFIPVDVVHITLHRSPASRPIAQIMAKVAYDKEFNVATTKTLQLRYKSVLRMFGQHPERGHAITWLPGKPLVALIQKQKRSRNERGLWEIHVADKYRTPILCWLSDVCG